MSVSKINSSNRRVVIPSGGNTPVTLLDVNERRHRVVVTNESDVDLLISYNDKISEVDYSEVIRPGEQLKLDKVPMYDRVIRGLFRDGVAGSGFAQICEWYK